MNHEKADPLLKITAFFRGFHVNEQIGEENQLQLLGWSALSVLIVNRTPVAKSEFICSKSSQKQFFLRQNFITYL